MKPKFRGEMNYEKDLKESIANVLNKETELEPILEHKLYTPPPQKPLDAYKIYYSEVKNTLMNENPKLSIFELSREIKSKWNKLEDSERRKYKEMEVKQKEEYDKKVKECPDIFNPAVKEIK